jgi:hypothetical protein
MGGKIAIFQLKHCKGEKLYSNKPIKTPILLKEKKIPFKKGSLAQL